MSQGIYLSLLSVLISLTCAVYLSYLPKPEKQAQRIRQAVAAAELEVAGKRLRIEISTGTAGPSHHLETLIRQADQGLYVDKAR